MYSTYCSIVDLRPFNSKLSQENKLGFVFYVSLRDEFGYQNPYKVLFMGG